MGATSRFVDLALAQRGKPYVWGAEGPDSFDCSGLVMWCARQVGISVPHYSAAQYERLRDLGLGISVEEAKVTRGALLYRGSKKRAIDVADEHVAISLGDGTTIEAISRTLGVRKSTVNGRTWHAAAKLPDCGPDRKEKTAAAAVEREQVEDEGMKKEEVLALRVDVQKDGQAITLPQALRGAYLNGLSTVNAVLALQSTMKEIKALLGETVSAVNELKGVVARIETREK
jgi:hypothetical protein